MHQPIDVEDNEPVTKEGARSQSKCGNAFYLLSAGAVIAWGAAHLTGDVINTVKFISSIPKGESEPTPLERAQVAFQKAYANRSEKLEGKKYPLVSGLASNNPTLQKAIRKKRLILVPEVHYGCRVCSKRTQIISGKHGSRQVLFLHEAATGRGRNFDALEDEPIIKIVAPLIVLGAEVRISDLDSLDPEILGEIVPDQMTQIVASKIPESTLTDYDKRVLTKLQKWWVSPDWVDEGTATEYLYQQRNEYPDEFRRFIGKLGIGAMEHLKELQDSKKLTFSSDRLDRDLMAAKSGKPITAEDYAEMYNHYHYDLREAFMVRNVLQNLVNSDKDTVYVGFGHGHSPGVYWNIRHALDEAGLSDFRIEIDPHSSTHDRDGHIQRLIEVETGRRRTPIQPKKTRSK